MRRAALLGQGDACGRPVQVLVLAAAQGPDEGDEPDAAGEQRDRYEEEQRVHDATAVGPAIMAARRVFVETPRFDPPIRRMALPMTMSEDKDMAMAATSGVT